MATPDEAVRNYLLAVREPEKLKDVETANKRKSELETTRDPIERLRLQQDILDAQHVDPKQYEDAFVTHAKAWAEGAGISHAAFQAEGVDDAVLRRAGFRLRRGAATPSRDGRQMSVRTRVSAEDVRAAIPKGAFRVQDIQDASGASAAVVRRVIRQEVEAGNVTDEGSDPNHAGPGRAPTLYRRA